jgi:hypothetical protein
MTQTNVHCVETNLHFLIDGIIVGDAGMFFVTAVVLIAFRWTKTRNSTNLGLRAGNLDCLFKSMSSL